MGSTGVPSIKLNEQLENAFVHISRAVSKDITLSNDLCKCKNTRTWLSLYIIYYIIHFKAAVLAFLIYCLLMLPTSVRAIHLVLALSFIT